MLHGYVTGAVVRSSVVIIEGHIVDECKVLDDIAAVVLAEVELVGLEDVNREVQYLSLPYLYSFPSGCPRL